MTHTPRTAEAFIDDMLSDGRTVDQIRAVASQSWMANQIKAVLLIAEERRATLIKMCGHGSHRRD